MARARTVLEVEAKLLIKHERDLAAIARIRRLGRHQLRDRGTVRLHSRYLDTPEMTLARHGVALRLRRQGDQWEATAKWAGRTAGSVHERPELTVPLAAAPGRRFRLPDGPLKMQLGALVAGRELNPILITHITRRRFDVWPSQTTRRRENRKARLAELVLDRVRLSSPGRTARLRHRSNQKPRQARYCEVEIELVNGTRRDIRELAARLQERFSLTPSNESKFARGLALLYGPGLQRGLRSAATSRSGLARALR